MMFMGPEMTVSVEQVATNTGCQVTVFHAIPAVLEDVALIDGRACAASAGCSISQWHNWVKQGTAPAPAIRRPRYTRWRICDVRQFLFVLVENASTNLGASQMVMRKAKMASEAAAEKARSNRSMTRKSQQLDGHTADGTGVERVAK
jgi:hypothetical protein